MVALDRVCHAHGCRLDKTLERATSFVTSAFNCSCCPDWTRAAITHRRIRRLGMNVSFRAERSESEKRI